MTFCIFSKNQGLHLIMEDVVESGPAWESGVRKGDIIVTVNDWLIVLMDRAQVRTFVCSVIQSGTIILCLLKVTTPTTEKVQSFNKH